MFSLLYLMLIAGLCRAHYRESYDSRNFIVREEPLTNFDGEIIECPVCEDSESWLPEEKCPIKKDNKTFMKCKYGTYINEVCGSRLDCYRGPGEQCTVKWAFDTYGKKCAPGYYCHKSLGICTGYTYHIDSNIQRQLNHFPYTFRRNDLKALPDVTKLNFEIGQI